MATTKRRELFKMVAQRADRHYKLSTVTTAGQGGIEDTALKAEADTDDGIVSVWVTMLETGDNAAPEGEITRALSSNAYTASSGVLLVEPDFTASTAQGESYMLTEISPYQIGYEIDRATRTLFPSLYLPIRDESIVIDNVLANNLFETYSGSDFTNWYRVNSPTTTQETAIVFHGSNSAKIVAGGSAGQMTSGAGGTADKVNVREMVGRRVVFRCWVWSDTADESRIKLDFGGSIESSDYHPGDSTWRLLKVDTSIPSGATQVKAILEVTANDTGYFDLASLVIAPVQKYTVPTTIALGPHRISMQQYEDQVQTFVRIGVNRQPIEGRLLRVEGMGRLTVPSTMNATVEVDETRAELIATAAAIRLVDSDDRDRKGDLIEEYNNLIGRPGVMMTSMSAQIPDTFHYESDSDGRYIVFDRPR